MRSERCEKQNYESPYALHGIQEDTYLKERKKMSVSPNNFKAHIFNFTMYMTRRPMQQCKTSAIVQLNMLYPLLEK